MNLKSFLHAAMLLLITNTVLPIFSQNNLPVSKTDSLSKLLKADLEDTNKVNHLNALAWELKYQNPDTAIMLSKQALAMASIIAGSQLAEKKQSAKKGISKAYGNLGAFYYIKGEYSLSLEFHFKALEIRESIGDKNGISISLNNIGLVFRDQGDYTTALQYYFKALKLNVEVGNKKSIAFNLNNIGLVYYDLRDYTKSLDYYGKAVRLNENLGNKNNVAENLNNIGNVYYAKANYPKALENYFKALKVNQEIGNTTVAASNLGNIGTSYFKKGDNSKALEYFLDALKLNEELGNKHGIASNLGNIGSVYANKKNHKDAEQYLSKALKIAEEIGTLELIIDNNQTLYTLYSETNRYQLAFEHYQQYSIAKDSLFNEDKSKEIGRLEMKHEIEKIESERKAQEEAAFKTATDKRNRKNELQFSGMFIGLLGIGLVVMMMGFVKVSPPIARSATFFAILLLFEFVLVLIDPYVDKFSSGEPLYKLLLNALLALCIFPVNALMERGIQKRLMKKREKSKLH